MITFSYDDGGRKAAGYKGTAGDCVARAIAIAAYLPYDEVYKALAKGNATQRRAKHNGRAAGVRTAREGIMTNRIWFRTYMELLGFRWVPTMKIGTGCKVHLREDELPTGKLVVVLSKHMCAVIDGIVHDTYDPSRGGTRCVYGYWIKE